LNFGGKAREIENTALKILQFLKRDWITTGRRPSGLCGACLFIAAKLHGFLITIDDVAEVVHVCNETIRKRINEFSLTDVATMSKEEFEQFEQTTYYSGKNPPAFTRNRHQENEEQKEAEYNDAPAEDVKDTQNNNLASGIFGSSSNIISKDGFKIPISFPKVKSIKSETDLSMLNEKDELNYLYNEKEYIVRKHIWDVMYKDWLDEQKEKKMYEKPMQLEPKKMRSRKVSSVLSQDSIKTPYEAIKSSGKKRLYSIICLHCIKQHPFYAIYFAKRRNNSEAVRDYTHLLRLF
jgi:transcription factor IIIB subunit 2